MIRTPYNTASTPSGAKVETFLSSLHGPGYVKISDPICMGELLRACQYSTLKVFSRAHGVEVDSSEFLSICAKTFVPGNGAWSVGGQTLKGYKDGTKPVRVWFEVQEAEDGGAYVIAYAEVHTPDGPSIRVQLDVEFD